MNESLKADIKGQKSKLTNESNKEEIYSKILDSILNLLVWNNELPEYIGNLEIRLNKKEIKRFQKRYKNIIWFIQNKKLWSEL